MTEEVQATEAEPKRRNPANKVEAFVYRAIGEAVANYATKAAAAEAQAKSAKESVDSMLDEGREMLDALRELRETQQEHAAMFDTFDELGDGDPAPGDFAPSASAALGQDAIQEMVRTIVKEEITNAGGRQGQGGSVRGGSIDVNAAVSAKLQEASAGLQGLEGRLNALEHSLAERIDRRLDERRVSDAASAAEAAAAAKIDKALGEGGFDDDDPVV